MTKKTVYKIPFVFRRTKGNLLTLPVLFNAIEKEGWDNYFDLQVADSFSTLLDRISNVDTCIIAYSFMTPQLPDVWEELRLLKKNAKKTILVAGGPHPTGDPQGTLKMGFDVISVGAGEETLPSICRAFLEQGLDLRKKIFVSQNILSLDESLPISHAMPIMPPLEISRGCHYHCRFCQTGLKKPIHRSLESVEIYLDELVRRNFIHRVGFICPSGFEYGSAEPGQPSPECIEHLLHLTKEKGIRNVEYGIFPSEVRPDTVSIPFLKLIRKFCTNKKLTIGAQAGSDRLLKSLKRGHSTQDIERAAALTHEHGLKPLLDFILGFPGESEEEQLQTLTWMKTLYIKYGARIQIHYFLPLPGTPLGDQQSSPLGKQSTSRLEQNYRDGICTRAWKQGMELSSKILRTKKRIQDTE